MTSVLNLVFIVFMTLSSYYIFLTGFFPVKSSLPRRSSYTNFSLDNFIISQPGRKASKVVLILIDALRADFVSESGYMPFIKDRLSQEAGVAYTLRAHPPTVTLPRIKALTSGSIPGFIDVVLNMDSAALNEDNVISQAYQHGRNIVFYGDDTWIKLFPNHFIRSEGTTSFFVTDYTEVDDNVTRHLSEELSAPDWDLMILHYLGLDHIGHTAGPHSPLVPPKLWEMDRIIQQIYNTLEEMTSEFVLLVCGDHGMSDQGSHGGASDSEVLVPAIFLGPKYTHSSPKGQSYLSRRELLQVDLAPTLAVVLGVPIPSNNLGSILSAAVPGLSGGALLDCLYLNSQQMVSLMQQNVDDITKESSYDLYKLAISFHTAYLRSGTSDPAEVSRVVRSYETAMEAIASKIAGSLTTYDVYGLLLAIVSLALCLMTVLLLACSPPKCQTKNLGLISYSILSFTGLFGHMTACTSQSLNSSTLCGWSFKSIAIQVMMFVGLHCLVGMLVSFIQHVDFRRQVPSLSNIEALLWLGTILHSVSFGSSSFVEEEHQTWYFLSTTLYLTLLAGLISMHWSHIGAWKHSRTETSNTTSFDTSTDEQGHNSDEQKQIPTLLCVKRSRSKCKETACEQNGNEQFKQQFPTTSLSACNELYEKYSLASVKQELASLPWTQWLPWKQCAAMTTVMFLTRILRRMNQTGNKWLDTPDFGDWLISPENKSALTLLVVLSLVVMSLVRQGTSHVVYGCFLAGLVGCFQYRVVTQGVYSLGDWGNDHTPLSKGITEARFVFSVILTLNLIMVLQWVYYKNKQQQTNQQTIEQTNQQTIEQTKHIGDFYQHEQSTSQHIDQSLSNDSVLQKQTCHLRIMNAIEAVQTSWLLLATLLLRTHNMCLVAMVTVQEQLVWRYVVKEMTLTSRSLALMCWWLGQAAYFQQGNSNSLSSVDVSAGYVGLEDYQPALVCLLLFCSTYAMPVYWLIALVKYSLHQQYSSEVTKASQSSDWCRAVKSSLHTVTCTLLAERLLTMLMYCVVVTSQRYHLFVWTVFSPKLLYEGMLTVMFTLFVIVISSVTAFLL